MARRHSLRSNIHNYLGFLRIRTLESSATRTSIRPSYIPAAIPKSFCAGAVLSYSRALYSPYICNCRDCIYDPKLFEGLAMSKKWCFCPQENDITMCHVEGAVLKEHKRAHGNGVPFGRLLAMLLPDRDVFKRSVVTQNPGAKIEQYVQVRLCMLTEQT